MINNLLNNIETIYLAYGATDFRKQIPSLCAEVKSKFNLNPYKKAAFIFCNKKRNVSGKRKDVLKPQVTSYIIRTSLEVISC